MEPYRTANKTDILQFNEIDEYIGSMQFNVKQKIPGFLVFDYRRLRHASFAGLPAYRHNYFEITLELSKGCSITVDHHDLPAEENRLTLIAPQRLQTILPHNRDPVREPYAGYGILFKPEFIHVGTPNTNLLGDFPFFNRLNRPSIKLAASEAIYLQEVAEKLLFEYENYGPYSSEIIQTYLKIILLKAKQQYHISDNDPLATGRDGEIFDKFQSLVHEYYLHLSSVKEYAERIHVTPKHLSETVRKVSGQTALHFIHRARLHHALALLSQTRKTITEIAYELNFENPEYFSVFFKRLTGKNPTQYRNS